MGFNPRPRVHDLRHCWLTNAARSGVHPATADAITGHGDKKKALQSLYTSISDKDLVKAIDMMQFDTGETEIWVKK
jgi:integrase